jgi:hypothetical protein
MKQGSEQGNQNRLMSQGDEELKVSLTAFDRLMKLAFGKSIRLFDISINCGLVLFLAMCALLRLYMTIRVPAVSILGTGCLYLAVISCAIAFSAYSISRMVNLVSMITAIIKGQKPRVFKEDDPLYAKLIKNAFKVTKAKGTDLFISLKTTACHKVSRIIVRVRANTRAYRSARRPAFAHSSHDGDGGGSGGDSGDSDQGDPPGPLHHTALLTLSKIFNSKSNSLSLPLRLHASGCCRIYRHEFSSRGRYPA